MLLQEVRITASLTQKQVTIAKKLPCVWYVYKIRVWCVFEIREEEIKELTIKQMEKDSQKGPQEEKTKLPLKLYQLTGKD